MVSVKHVPLQGFFVLFLQFSTKKYNVINLIHTRGITKWSKSSIILSSTKLAISKWTPILGVEEASRLARRDRRAARSPEVKSWTWRR